MSPKKPPILEKRKLGIVKNSIIMSDDFDEAIITRQPHSPLLQ